MGNVVKKKKADPGELLRELCDTTADLLARRGVEAETAAAIAIELVDWLRTSWGKTQLYIPEMCEIDISRRDMEIWEAFPKKSQAELASEYDLSIIYVYRILKTVGDAMRAKRQGDLFKEAP